MIMAKGTGEGVRPDPEWRRQNAEGKRWRLVEIAEGCGENIRHGVLRCSGSAGTTWRLLGACFSSEAAHVVELSV